MVNPYLYNKSLLISSSKSTFKVWDLFTNSLIKTISSNLPVCSIIYAPFNEYKDLFLSTHNSLIRCWSVLNNNTHKSYFKLYDHNNEIKIEVDIPNNIGKFNSDKKILNDTVYDFDFDILEETSFINKLKNSEYNYINNSVNKQVYVVNHNNNYNNNNNNNNTAFKDNTISDNGEQNDSNEIKNSEHLVFSIEAHTKDIKCSLVNPKHKVLITGGSDYNVVVTDLLNQTIKKKIIEHTASVNCLESINDDIFASASQDSTIKLFNISNMKKSLFTICASKVAINFILNLKVYYGKIVLVIGNIEGEIKIFDLMKKKFLTKIKHKGNLKKGELFNYSSYSTNFVNVNDEKKYSGVFLEDDFSLIFFNLVD